jgi:hypothetical protein
MRILLIAILGLAGCGGGGGAACSPLSGSCTQRSGTFCTEYGGLPAEALTPIMMSCTRDDPDGKNTWSSSGCSHTGSVGACMRMQQGACVAAWLYGPAELAAQAKTQCTGMQGTWVDP